MRSLSVWIALSALMLFTACVDENAPVLSGPFVQAGEPGELFVPGRPRTVMRCVSNVGGVNGRMTDYTFTDGGELRARQGWKATFTSVGENRVRVTVLDAEGATNPDLDEAMRGWLEQCAWP